MVDRDDCVAGILDAAGGEIVGRIRLQKIFYLLDELGLGSGFDYQYHHYGPYSADLTAAVSEACAFGKTSEKFRYRTDGMQYSIFALTPNAPLNTGGAYGRLNKTTVASTIEKMKRYDSTVLELAAAIRWLREKERLENWQPELKRRKGAKADGRRIKQALALLKELGLGAQ